MAEVDYSTKIPPEIFNYRKSPYNYFAKTAVHSAVGLAIGIALDKSCEKIQQGYNLRPGLMIIIQLMVLIIIFYAIEFYIDKGHKYILEFQNITPGLFFAGLLFGSQLNLFNNIKKFTKPL